MGSKILVADDSITIQKVIGLSFANEDFILETADNGDEALQKAQASSPDLVIADTNMPGLSGYEVCESIRRDPKLAHIPVILLTGTYEVFDEDRAKQVGANDHLTKPFESQVLIKKVKQLLATQPAVASTPPTPAIKTAEPEPVEEIEAFEEIETIEAMEEIEEVPAASMPEPLDFSDVSEDDPFGFGGAPTPPAVAAAPIPEPIPDPIPSPVTEAAAVDAGSGGSDWNMDEFKTYLASQESEETVPHAEAVAEIAPEEDSWADVGEPAAEDPFAEFESSYEDSSATQSDTDNVELESIAAQMEPQQLAEDSVELDDVIDEPALELTTDHAFETTFDVDIEDTPLPPPPVQQPPVASAIDVDALESRIRSALEMHVSSTLDDLAQDKIQSAVQSAVEKAVSVAVEKAVAQVLDELRRRLS